MISISIKDLVLFEKKTKKLSARIKKLEQEKQNILIELEEKNTINNSEKMKSDISIEGLEQTCKAL